jgi:hypothetical protein
VESVTCRRCGHTSDRYDNQNWCLHCGAPLPGSKPEPAATSSSGDTGVFPSVSEGDPFANSGHQAIVRLSATREIRLDQGDRLVLGRAEESPLADVCKDNVPSHHAEIYVNELGTFIEDTDSTNGTWVDGERLVPRSPRELWSTASVQLCTDPPLRFTVSVEVRGIE